MAEIWQNQFWPTFGYDARVIEPLLAEVQELLGEVHGLNAGLTPEERSQMQLVRIVQEAVASFGIEGVALDPSQIEASVIASLRHREHQPPLRRSDAIAQLMLAARSGAGGLTADVLQDWHRMLFHGIEVEDLGQWRGHDIEIIRSAQAGKNEVLYRAPPPRALAQEMAVFLNWLETEAAGLALPIRAGIAHLWFESIHPFSDGNGRIGRAMIEHIFAQAARPLAFSLSRQIEREKRDYYAALQAGRRAGAGHVDATEFLRWFLACLARAAAAGRDEALFLVRRNAYFLRFGADFSPRQRKALEVLFAQGPARLLEGISASSYAKITAASPATATRDLAALEQSGALSRSEAGGRSTRYNVLY